MAAEQTDQEKLGIMRHSASHIMAQAVKYLFPEAKFAIGPSIQDGFYYDFQLPRALTPEDLPAIEQRMGEIVTSNLPFSRKEISKAEARRMFAEQPFKLELLDEIPDETVSLYEQGDFVDLCRGPHISTTGEVKAFKLTSIAGAYWRGDEKRPMLQRIYGTAFESAHGLADYLSRIEEANRRDHRKLGKELDLFSLHDEAGPGLVYWHPAGSAIRRAIEDFWKAEHVKRGYEIVYTPHIGKVELWKTSGHWNFYRENMYSPMVIDEQQYVLKPMNCIGHIMIFKTRMRSYRDLPIRYAELGTVYRYERSGVLHGLSRVRGFTQDDAHLFCRFEQLESEVMKILELTRFMMKTFGFENYKVMLSTRPEGYAGSLEMWEQATEILRQSLVKSDIPYTVDPGEGVFYGPKIDTKIQDALGHDWQGPTIQVDFNMPKAFDVNYIGEDGKEHMVAMVHRTVLGSMERFLAVLVEHYGGAFPVWLAPVQVRIIPVADRHTDYAMQIEQRLKNETVRVNVDSRSERMNLKIREAQLQKIPYMVIIGDKEVAAATISVRTRAGEQINNQSLAAFQERLLTAINSKARE